MLFPSCLLSAITRGHCVRLPALAFIDDLLQIEIGAQEGGAHRELRSFWLICACFRVEVMRFFLALVVLCALVACAYAFTDLGRVQQQLGGKFLMAFGSFQNNALGVVKVDQTPAQSRSKRQSIFSGAGAGFVKVDRKQPPQVPRPKRFTA